MLTWIKRLFTNTDRAERASERIAVALEDMAEIVEEARDELRRHREPVEVEASPAPNPNGKRRALVK